MADSTAEDKSRKPTRRRTRSPIDENLRKVYEDMVDDDVPERFLQLLDKLRDQGGER